MSFNQNFSSLMVISSQHSDLFHYDEGSPDVHLTLTPSQADISSTFTPFIETERVKVIWGTTVNVQVTSEKIKEFVRSSTEHLQQLENMNLTQKFVFNFDSSQLDPVLNNELVSYPQEVIPIFQSALREIYMERYVESPLEIHIRPYNIGRPLNIRTIEPKNIDKIVYASGMVVRSSGIIPEMRRALFHCLKCSREVSVDAVKNMINEPSSCECGGKYTFELKHNDSIFTDKQIVKLQELPESIPDGTTPMTLTIVSKDDLVDALVPGDKVTVTGIFKAVPVRINPIFKKVKNTFRCFIELLSVKLLSKKEEIVENFDEILKLKNCKNLYEKLSQSIAPSVFGLENVKKALLLQLLGGVSKDLGNSRLRGDINILLAGDPGISKSQLLSFVHRLSERGIYTSGKGSSAVGLTASISKDHDSGQFILESGALVLSDGGICCIDEFDKMSDSTRSVLHEVMEQQTVSVAKAGIITTLNARCSILASCNPIESKYNLKKSIIENINLPSTLLSRFDIVCLMIDKSDELNDKNVADHIVGMYTGEHTKSEVVNADLLKAYIKEARKINPKLSQEGIEALKDSYVELRQLDNGNSITATTRQLESLVRLSEAHARLRFSDFVEKQDVKEAIRLIKESLLLYALDPRTGKIDVDMIITGNTAARTKLIEDLKSAILKIVKKRMLVSEILEQTGADEKMLNEAINELENEDLIYFDQHNNTVERIK